ncbi:MAG: transcriptional regulator NrdR [Myxococcota bacterium]|nr:transcriptional regulator NrdR [Myxococcota bacterium]
MRCPGCDHPESKVIDSRTVRDGDAIRRRRECDDCGERFTTYERIEDTVLMVVKKDGRREAFDRDKIHRGIRLACNKRPISEDAVRELVEKVAKKAHGLGEREVPSNQVGHAVAEGLLDMDEVAYVRFVSVYRRFEDTAEFRRALDRLTAGGSGEDS